MGWARNMKKWRVLFIALCLEFACAGIACLGRRPGCCAGAVWCLFCGCVWFSAAVRACFRLLSTCFVSMICARERIQPAGRMTTAPWRAARVSDSVFGCAVCLLARRLYNFCFIACARAMADFGRRLCTLARVLSTSTSSQWSNVHYP